MASHRAQPDTAATVEEASLALVEVTLRALSAAGPLSVLQARVLLAVDRHGPLRLGQLADQVRLSLSSASRLASRLVDDGLLLRRTPTHDRRQLELVLSARGGRTVLRLRAARQSGIERIMAQMSADEREALAVGLTGFSEAARADPELVGEEKSTA